MLARLGREEPLDEAVIAGLEVGRVVGHRDGGAAERPRAHALQFDLLVAAVAVSKCVAARRDGQQECGRQTAGGPQSGFAVHAYLRW